MIHTKRWQCECGKKYFFISNAHKHNKNKHNSKAKFTDIAELLPFQKIVNSIKQKN